MLSKSLVSCSLLLTPSPFWLSASSLFPVPCSLCPFDLSSKAFVSFFSRFVCRCALRLTAIALSLHILRRPISFDSLPFDLFTLPVWFGYVRFASPRLDLVSAEGKCSLDLLCPLPASLYLASLLATVSSQLIRGKNSIYHIFPDTNTSMINDPSSQWRQAYNLIGLLY